MKVTNKTGRKLFLAIGDEGSEEPECQVFLDPCEEEVLPDGQVVVISDECVSK